MYIRIMAVSLNTFTHLAIICVFVGIFSWNLIDYREGLTDEGDDEDEDADEGDDDEAEVKPKKKLSKKELARKKKADIKKVAKERKDAQKAQADLEDRL